MEPFFSVVLSAIFLNENPTLPVVLCLLPIVGGVAVASVTEVMRLSPLSDPFSLT